MDDIKDAMLKLDDVQRTALIASHGEPTLRLEFDVFADGSVSMWTHFSHEDDFLRTRGDLTLIRDHLNQFIADEGMCPFAPRPSPEPVGPALTPPRPRGRILVAARSYSAYKSYVASTRGSSLGLTEANTTFYQGEHQLIGLDRRDTWVLLLMPNDCDLIAARGGYIHEFEVVLVDRCDPSDYCQRPDFNSLYELKTTWAEVKALRRRKP